ncbi:MAG: adenylosuccinate lyase [Desulfosalsimonadaceae bacterium]
MGICSLSVLDGRYRHYTEVLRDIFSEYGLIKSRVCVETQWLKFLLFEMKLDRTDDGLMACIDRICENFDAESARAVKAIEAETNHDVKAVEYYIKQQLIDEGYERIKEWVHFACTSEDINNTAYGLMLKAGRNHIVPLLRSVQEKLEKMALAHKHVPMMSRTHGQPATPTTVGKEMINFAWRIRMETDTLETLPVFGKINGASGNFNAHHFVLPDIDWISASKRFLRHYLDLEPVLYTTQINPYNHLSAILHAMVRLAAVFIDLDRDMWGYISHGYFSQKLKDGEVGSSTMPHKVNPIDFENSEGNMGLAISMMDHMAVKLLISRFQRDLSDSTVLRNIGALFGYFVIGLKSTLKGMDKLAVNEAVIQKDLADNLELLAEPVQTAMRLHGENRPYEKLKELTRGRKITREDLGAFVENLESLPAPLKTRIAGMQTAEYIGLAEKLVDQYFSAPDEPV